MASNNNQKKKKSYLLQKSLISLLLIVCIVLNGVYFIYSTFMSRINFVAPTTPGGSVTLTDYDISYTDMTDPTAAQDDDDSDNIPDNVIVNTEDVTLYLLIGSDSRIDSKSTNTVARSDSIIIAAVDRKHKKIKLISLMRDMLVKIAGTKSYNRINVAFYNDSRFKDLNLTRTRNTIHDTFGVQLDRFVVVDFTGFKKLIDIMGGVDIEVNAAEAKYMCSDKKYGYFKRYSKGAGTYHMTGSEALNYARMRHVGGGSDFDRTERQRKMINVIIDQMKNQSYANLVVLINSALGYITTNIPEAEILGLAFEAPTMLNYSVVQMRLPIENTYAFKQVMLGGYKSSVLWCNYKRNSKELAAFIYDDKMDYTGSKYKRPNYSVPALPASVKLATTTTTTTAAATE